MALPALVLAALMLFGPATQAWYAIPLMICAGLLRVSARWLEGIGITVNVWALAFIPASVVWLVGVAFTWVATITTVLGLWLFSPARAQGVAASSTTHQVARRLGSAAAGLEASWAHVAGWPHRWDRLGKVGGRPAPGCQRSLGDRRGRAGP